MDGFSYVDIFDTKGIEYIVVIMFLLLIIPYWRALNKPVRVRQRQVAQPGILTEKLLKMPAGLLYSMNHTWSLMERNGMARIGIDDLLLHLTGGSELKNVVSPGTMVHKGDRIAEIGKNGRRLSIKTPVSGEVSSVNTLFAEDPLAINDQERGKDWIIKVRPSEWKKETDGFIMGEEARKWSKYELERFRDFAAGWMSSQEVDQNHVILQAGGELVDNPLSEMPSEAWTDFEKIFLSRIH